MALRLNTTPLDCEDLVSFVASAYEMKPSLTGASFISQAPRPANICYIACRSSPIWPLFVDRHSTCRVLSVFRCSRNREKTRSTITPRSSHTAPVRFNAGHAGDLGGFSAYLPLF
ncbi:hypothetical protein NDU88_009496 [Pleurodeles waltl]|uniref:Uncharacterized protein n=1 Tax=Pleurodeles waltl TaxID=8319 RepID=A0AAV7PSD4_PLEWA|nr:hypothetical protein NDU88_009496 [Pleurodeles waltl]